MSIEDPTKGDASAFHLDYFVDTDPSSLRPGEVVPAGNTAIIHSGAESLDLKLPSGPHQVWAVLSNAGHIPCRSADGRIVLGSTQFTVPPGAGANEREVAGAQAARVGRFVDVIPGD